MPHSQSNLEQYIRRLFDDEGVILLECSTKGYANTPLVRVIGDRRQGSLTIDDCVRLTRQIQFLIAEYRLVADNYRLEVSSPGLDYPLREEWQFNKNIGRLIKITVSGERGPKEISGRLSAADTAGITLTANGTQLTPRYSELLSACILPEFNPPRSESKE